MCCRLEPRRRSEPLERDAVLSLGSPLNPSNPILLSWSIGWLQPDRPTHAPQAAWGRSGGGWGQPIDGEPTGRKLSLNKKESSSLQVKWDFEIKLFLFSASWFPARPPLPAPSQRSSLRCGPVEGLRYWRAWNQGGGGGGGGEERGYSSLGPAVGAVPKLRKNWAQSSGIFWWDIGNSHW